MKGKSKINYVEEKSEKGTDSNSKAKIADKKSIKFKTLKGEGSAKGKDFEAPLQSKTTFASKKATLTSPKEHSKVTTSNDVAKKTDKSTLQQLLNHDPINDYIRFTGFEETKVHWNCALCEKSLTGDEEASQKNKLFRHPLYFEHHRAEEESASLLPEVAVLPCTHVFHSTCLSAVHHANITDPPCPMCLSMLSI